MNKNSRKTVRKRLITRAEREIKRFFFSSIIFRLISLIIETCAFRLILARYKLKIWIFGLETPTPTSRAVQNLVPD